MLVGAATRKPFALERMFYIHKGSTIDVNYRAQRIALVF